MSTRPFMRWVRMDQYAVLMVRMPTRKRAPKETDIEATQRRWATFWGLVVIAVVQLSLYFLGLAGPHK